MSDDTNERRFELGRRQLLSLPEAGVATATLGNQAQASGEAELQIGRYQGGGYFTHDSKAMTSPVQENTWPTGVPRSPSTSTESSAVPECSTADRAGWRTPELPESACRVTPSA